MNAPPKTEDFNQQAFTYVGTRPVRPDGEDKVTGKAIYGPDFVAPNMLHGAMLRSPHPHARIRAIDTRKAEALAGRQGGGDRRRHSRSAERAGGGGRKLVGHRPPLAQLHGARQGAVRRPRRSRPSPRPAPQWPRRRST